MHSIIFRLLAWDGPSALVEVELGPCHGGDFVAALGCESEKLCYRTKRPTAFVAGRPQPAQLVIAENAIAGLFLRRQFHARDWRDGTRSFSIAQLNSARSRATVRLAWTRRRVNDAVDRIQYVATADAGDGSPPPLRDHVAIDDPLRFSVGRRHRVFCEVPLEIVASDGAERVLFRRARVPTRSLLFGGVEAVRTRWSATVA